MHNWVLGVQFDCYKEIFTPEVSYEYSKMLSL